jgi:hypothetical protein
MSVLLLKLRGDSGSIRMITEAGILYIEPTSTTSHEPVIDELTMKMAGALRQATSGIGTSRDFLPGAGYRGVHKCNCGAMSSNCEYRLPGGEVTNSLATHYLAWHRDEIDPAQLDKVSMLNVEPVQPTEDELRSPRR